MQARGFTVLDNLVFSRILGTLLFLLLLTALWAARRYRRDESPLADLLCAGVSWSVFTFIATGLISVARTFRGFSQPLTPRYATYGSFCVLGVLLLRTNKSPSTKCDFSVVQRADGALQFCGHALRKGDSPAHFVLVCLGKRDESKSLIVGAAVPHAPPPQHFSGYRKDFEFCYTRIESRSDSGAFAGILAAEKISGAGGKVLTAFALDQQRSLLIPLPGTWLIAAQSDGSYLFKRIDRDKTSLGTEPEEQP